MLANFCRETGENVKCRPKYCISRAQYFSYTDERTRDNGIQKQFLGVVLF